MSEWILIVLLVVQQVFWMLSTHRLMNKLMSRNYQEYEHVAQGPKPKAPRLVDPDPQEDLGAMDGMGGF